VSRTIYHSRRAEADLAAILEDGEREYGPDAAEKYLAELDRKMQLALEYPVIGSDYSHIRDGYRKLISGSHLIFYIPHDDGIEIMRVVPARMDIEAALI
jgi:toxin ParE1/3/4